MSGPLTYVQIAGLNLRVPKFRSEEATNALVERVNAKLKDLESHSTKVNTQAFALQAAYEFAVEVAELKEAYAVTETRFVESIKEIEERVFALRNQIEEGGGNSAKT